MAHTPGPWAAQGETWGSVYQTSGHKHGVAYDIYQVDDQRLIAAAPDLLAALKRLRALPSLWSTAHLGIAPRTLDDERTARAMAEAAIKKAEGE